MSEFKTFLSRRREKFARAFLRNSGMSDPIPDEVVEKFQEHIRAYFWKNVGLTILYAIFAVLAFRWLEGC